jgi:hypothetical protein
VIDDEGSRSDASRYLNYDGTGASDSSPVSEGFISTTGSTLSTGDILVTSTEMKVPEDVLELIDGGNSGGIIGLEDTTRTSRTQRKGKQTKSSVEKVSDGSARSADQAAGLTFYPVVDSRGVFERLWQQLQKDVAEVDRSNMDSFMKDVKKLALKIEFETNLKKEQTRIISNTESDLNKLAQGNYRRSSLLSPSDRASLGGNGTIASWSSSGNSESGISADAWDRKIRKVQSIFGRVFGPRVMGLIQDFASRQDISGAWAYLNRLYYGYLKKYATTFLTALEVYTIRVDQSFERYIWCVEVICDACAAIKGFAWTDEEMVNLVIKGVEDNYRFKSLCAAVKVASIRPSYAELKSMAMNLEHDRVLDRTVKATLMSTLMRSMENKGGNKRSRGNNNSNSKLKSNGDESSDDKDVKINHSKSEDDKSKNGDKKKNKENVTCFNCNEKGHYSNECEKKKKKKGSEKDNSNVNTSSVKDVHNEQVNTVNKNSAKINNSLVFSVIDSDYSDDDMIPTVKFNMMKVESPPNKEIEELNPIPIFAYQIKTCLANFQSARLIVTDIDNRIEDTIVDVDGEDPRKRQRFYGSRSSADLPINFDPDVLGYKWRETMDEYIDTEIRALQFELMAFFDMRAERRGWDERIARRILEYLQLGPLARYLIEQAVTIEIVDVNKPVRFRACDRVNNVCYYIESANLCNAVLFNCARSLEHIVNRYNFRNRWRIMHMHPIARWLKPVRNINLYIKEIYSWKRFWVLDRDYDWVNQTVFAICVADMCPHLQLILYEVVAGIRVSNWDHGGSKFEYYATENLSVALDNAMEDVAVNRQFLCENLLRMESIFNLNDDLYYYVRKYSAYSSPSGELCRLYTGFLHDVQHWFATACAGNQFNVELIPHSGFYVHYIVPSATSRHREYIADCGFDQNCIFEEPGNGEEIFLIRDVDPDYMYLEVAHVKNTGFTASSQVVDSESARLHMISTRDKKILNDMTRSVVKFEVDEILIWDTGASEHLFQYLPHNAHGVRDKKFNVLLGGSSNHKVRTSYIFSIGFLQEAL